MAKPIDDLENELATFPSRVLVIAGAGVSRATDPSSCASWSGLLEHGVGRCRDRCGHLSERWFEITQSLIHEATAADLIQAATRIENALRDVHDGEYARWLSESVGALRVRNDRIIRGLVGWSTRIATTNYDNLFSEFTGLRPVTWLQGDLALQVLRGDDPGILHLHGHYTAPDSVIFGARTYEDICRDPRAQTLLRSTFARDTIVFVGCGAGIEDPNVGGLLAWSRDALKACVHTHFHLVTEKDLKAVQRQYQDAGARVTPVPYGPDHKELPKFLEDLAERLCDRRTAPSPLVVLNRSQADYETSLADLRRRRGELTTDEFVRRQFELARGLWQAGGRRVAALAMDQALMSGIDDLSAEQQLAYGLEAAERLLDDGVDFSALVRLQALAKQIDRVSPPADTLAQFRRLLARALAARSEVEQAVRAIGEALPQAGLQERGHLEAERAELHLLTGDLDAATQAATDGEPG